MNVERGYAVCKAVTTAYAKSFAFASLAMHGPRRRAAFALYAYCRWLDELVDGDHAPTTVRLTEARELTRAIFHAREEIPALAGRLGFDVDGCAALADTVARYQVPEAPLQDLIS